MSEHEWRRLVDRGGQCRHQAHEILKRPASSWECGDPWSASWRRWAIFVLTMDTDPSREFARRPAAPGGAPDFQITPPR